jgi:endonuclease/exonuclease/phosphatase family metal-dependent hydrolase
MATTLRFAICNLQTGIGTTRGYWHYLATAWKYVLPHHSAYVERAGAFLGEAAVDVAAFCEIGGGSWRTRGVDQAALIARSSPLVHHAFFPAFVAGRRINQGNAFCSRYPVQPIANHPLPGPGEPRFLSEAEVRIDGRAVRVFVTHLSLQLDVRTPQLRRIAALTDRVDRPTVLAGDFNISQDAELQLLAESQLQQVPPCPTYPAWKPARALDHLFFSEHFTIGGSAAFDRFLFSDHLPLTATVTLTPDA